MGRALHLRQDRRISLTGDAHEALYAFCVSLWVACEIMLNTTAAGLLPFHMLTNVALVLALYGEVIFGDRSRRTIAAGAALLILAYMLKRVDQGYIGRIALLVWCGRDLDVRRLLKTCCVVEGIMLVGVVIACGFGAIGNVGVARLDGSMRESLGFYYVTFLSHYFLNFALMWIYLRKDRLRWYEVAALLAINIAIYSATGSRNSFILVCAALALAFYALVLKRGVPQGKAAEFVLMHSYVLCAALVIVSMLVIGAQSPLGALLDKALSGRLTLSQRALDTYGITPVGTAPHWVYSNEVRSGLYAGDEYFYVDSSYVQILICCGVVVFALILLWFTLTLVRAYKGGDSLLCWVFLAFAIHSALDPQMMKLDYCCFLLCLGPTIKAPLPVATADGQTAPAAHALPAEPIPVAMVARSLLHYFAPILIGAALGAAGLGYAATLRAPTYSASASIVVVPSPKTDATREDAAVMLSDQYRMRKYLAQEVGEDAIEGTSVSSGYVRGTDKVWVTVEGGDADRVGKTLDALLEVGEQVALSKHRYLKFYPVGDVTTSVDSASMPAYAALGGAVGAAAAFALCVIVRGYYWPDGKKLHRGAAA